ncbi:MAG: 30S ribosomal protein S7 [Chamaesiphon sp. CSU_1_12]|nr:30S ribosomal protein S7 [Chamaesiphon sp. CSU_1_12]
MLCIPSVAEPKGPDSPGEARRAFGFRWFVPELLRHRAIWRDVLLASLAIQVMALATPVFTQIVIDKVIVHHTLSTLAVIGIVYGAFDVIQERYKADPLDTFRKALDAVKPKLEVKSRRVGGATYQVPVEVRPDRRTALAMRWLISYSRDRNEKSMPERLAAEVIAASKGEGNAIKKKEDTHRMAEANKAFAHYRW